VNITDKYKWVLRKAVEANGSLGILGIEVRHKRAARALKEFWRPKRQRR